MPKICLVAAVDENLGLGQNNQLLCHLPADLKHFKEITLGKPIIMGKNTFLSIGKPLPGRQNIVISRLLEPTPGLEITPTLEDALKLANQAHAPEIMIIGGAQVFQGALALADAMYLTHIHHQFKADVFFPSWDESEWDCVATGFRPADESNVYDLTFKKYQRIN